MPRVDDPDSDPFEMRVLFAGWSVGWDVWWFVPAGSGQARDVRNEWVKRAWSEAGRLFSSFGL